MLLLQNGDVVTSATGVTSYSGLNCNCPASMAVILFSFAVLCIRIRIRPELKLFAS